MLRERNPDKTREKILMAAAEEIYRQGYQGMRVNNVLQQTGLTKGALYHHFPTKTDLGYAVVEELLMAEIRQHWVEPLDKDGNVIDTIINHLQTQCQSATPEMISCGCPLNNVSQEMSSIDEGFRTRIKLVYSAWVEAISASLSKGQAKGEVKMDLDADNTARFLVASLEGIMGSVKCSQESENLVALMGCLVDYLNSLRS
ncbi:MAG: TetR/AcrR family transcriptional regulator [Amphritea sp.]